MNKYEAYKDPGVEWIGEIPSHWAVRRLKQLSEVIPSNVDKHIFPEEIQVRLCNYTDVYYNEKIDSTTPMKNGSCDEYEYQKFHVQKNDVIITKDSESPDDIGVPCLISEQLDGVVCGYHLTILRPVLINGEYLFRFVQTDGTRRYFEVNSNGMTRYGLGKSSIENLVVCSPPLLEQEQIVSFLDEKTSLIDDLISKKEEKIGLLKEYRTALINRVITKGLNPDCPMKDCGAEWIGEIPSHWITSNLGHYTTKIGSGSTPRGGSEVYVDEGIKFIRSQNVHFQGLVLDDVSFIDTDTHETMSNTNVRRYDVLLNITGGSIGRCCVVDIEEEMNVNQHVCIIRTKQPLLHWFLNYFLQCDLGQTQVRFNLTGGNREGLTIDGIKAMIIVLPPLPEQEQIVSFLDQKTGEIDETIHTERKKIELLKEYRQSLISSVVTGKIKVVN